MSISTLVVYVDDAAHAQPLLTTLAFSPDTRHQHWLLLACAPRISYRTSRWASHRTRENWREQWAAQLFAELSTGLQQVQAPAQLTLVLARQPLKQLLTQLQQAHTVTQIIDARRPQHNATSLPGLLTAAGSLFTWLLEESLV